MKTALAKVDTVLRAHLEAKAAEEERLRKEREAEERRLRDEQIARDREAERQKQEQERKQLAEQQKARRDELMHVFNRQVVHRHVRHGFYEAPYGHL